MKKIQNNQSNFSFHVIFERRKVVIFSSKEIIWTWIFSEIVGFFKKSNRYLYEAKAKSELIEVSQIENKHLLLCYYREPTLTLGQNKNWVMCNVFFIKPHLDDNLFFMAHTYNKKSEE